mmetsp:Transcript_17053/g.21877  ORF Transcript_17053/g.21877 Transcript_17053/m.21877 type:complete len:115 (+) Transcript_17053:287-631(+)
MHHSAPTRLLAAISQDILKDSFARRISLYINTVCNTKLTKNDSCVTIYSTNSDQLFFKKNFLFKKGLQVLLVLVDLHETSLNRQILLFLELAILDVVMQHCQTAPVCQHEEQCL